MSKIEISTIFIGYTGIETLSNGSTYDSWFYSPNSENGAVGVKHAIFNASDKDIKYVTFIYEPINAVNDVVKCQVSGESERAVKLTGPIESHQKYDVAFENLWYNPTVSKVVIRGAHVQYMDNSEETILGDEILNIYDSNSVYKKLEDARKAEEKARKQQQKEETIEALNGLKDSVVGGLKGLFKKK